MTKEIKYKLKNAFEYSSNGLTVFAKEITLFAPTRAILGEAAVIQGQILRNSLEASKLVPANKIPLEENKKEDVKMSGEQYLSLLSLSENADNSFQAFDRILTFQRDGMRFALIDNMVPFTNLLVSKLSVEDYEGLLGAYIESFLSHSLAK